MHHLIWPGHLHPHSVLRHILLPLIHRKRILLQDLCIENFCLITANIPIDPGSQIGGYLFVLRKIRRIDPAILMTAQETIAAKALCLFIFLMVKQNDVHSILRQIIITVYNKCQFRPDPGYSPIQRSVFACVCLTLIRNPDFIFLTVLSY